MGPGRRGRRRRRRPRSCRLHQAQQRAHPTAVASEDAQVSPREQLVGAAVIELDMVDVQGGLSLATISVQGVGDDREVAQSQKVHLLRGRVLTGGVGRTE